MSDESGSAAEEAVEKLRVERREEFRRVIQRLDRETGDVVGARTEDVVAETVEAYGTHAVLDTLRDLLRTGIAFVPERGTMMLTEPVDDADDGEPELVSDGGEPDDEDVDVWEDGILIADGGRREVVERVSGEGSAYTLKVEVLDPGEHPEYEPAGYHSPTVLYTAFTPGQVHAHYDAYKLVEEIDGRNDWLLEHCGRLREEVMADV